MTKITHAVVVMIGSASIVGFAQQPGVRPLPAQVPSISQRPTGSSLGTIRVGAADNKIWFGWRVAIPANAFKPHTFSDALTIAANLHVVAASSNAPIIEYDRTYNEIQEKLVKNPLSVHDSVIELPTEPGLGVEIDWDFVADHPYTGEIGIGAGSRPAFGLATEVIPDRTTTSLA